MNELVKGILASNLPWVFLGVLVVRYLVKHGNALLRILRGRQ